MIINDMSELDLKPRRHTHICDDNKYTRKYEDSYGIVTETICLICGFQLGRMSIGKEMLDYFNPLLKNVLSTQENA